MRLKLAVLNQRGGVGKTTTSTTLARQLADVGWKVLLIDADAQGTVNTMLRLNPTNSLYEFAVRGYGLEDCVVSPVSGLDILCSNRRTADAEKQFVSEVARERLFETLLELYEEKYDAVLIDCGPSVSLLQTCAMVYARQVLIPVNTDLVSVSGAGACLQFCETLSKAIRTKISAVALLPTMVDRRIGLTKIVGHLLGELSSRYAVPILSEIRTDASVGKATRARQFLVDFDHRSKALEDYKVVAEQLLGILTEAKAPAVDPTSDSLLVADVKE